MQRSYARNACQVGEEEIPICETCVGEKGSFLPIIKARQKISELKANCPIATRGCRWNVTLSKLETHFDVCQEFLVNMTFVNGNAVAKCSFYESKFKDTPHGNQSKYLVSVIISNILFVSLFLILVSGDIESNPGPLGSGALSLS